ncbi:MAG: PEGA domain-containing protein [Archangiaceae bacterium]|nr:PEGA domain-containing protein [Archangiaceae bacterium]
MRGILFAVMVMIGCAHGAVAPEPRAEDRPEQRVMVADEPGLKVLAEPSDAELVIDGQSYGKVSAMPGALSLKPGIYQVSLKREGYETWRAEVSVGEKTEQLTVTLVKR